jgi:hypothetical protein
MWKILLTAPVLAAAMINGSTSPAMADTPGSTVALDLPTRSASAATCVPNSTQPAAEWFCWTTYFGGEQAKNKCDVDGLAIVLSGQATGSACAPRFDQTGFDLWLRM